MQSPSIPHPKAHDTAFFEKELASFVPDRVFDAHAHLCHPDFFPANVPDLPDKIDYHEYQKYIQWLFPGREVAALFLSFTFDENLTSKNNAWIAEQVALDPNCRGLYFVKPDDDPEFVRQEVCRLGLHGLKCYHTFASSKPTWEANIPEYFPENLAKIAHEEGWVVTLHMVKSRAVADPENIHWIRHYCQNYPNMKLILAHSARGFQPSHNLEGLPQLQGLENLYFDSSANCEPMAHTSIIKFFGHEKLLYGADSLVASHIRGRTMAVADSFLWITEETPVWKTKYAEIEPTLLGLEHLRSMKWSCWSLGLSDSAIEDIFWNNAARLLNIE